ncbi:MAG: NAD(P)H-hydrate dehydratase [Promethearchaeota archaeon]
MKQNISEKISSEEMRVLDNNAEWLGIPKSHLMECAGYSFATEVVNRYKLGENSKVVIFCGTGNNGGDGFVVARHLSSIGVKVLVILVGVPKNIRTKHANLNWNIIFEQLNSSIQVEIVKDSTDVGKIGALIKDIGGFDLIIDGLLGTGIKGNIREPISSAIDLINVLKEEKLNGIQVVSIDVPSGLNPNTGEVSDKAIKADLIITFHRAKKGLEIKSEHVKEVIVKSIGIPQEANLFIGRGDLIPTLKVRRVDSHKGQFGKILVIGGSKKYSGAPAYASLAAINFGIDLVITHVPQVIGNVLRNYSPNLIIRTSPGDWLNMKSFKEISQLINWSDSIIIGPGLGEEKETEELLINLLEKICQEKKPFVLDADALKLVKNHLDLIKDQPAILTPHEGELQIMTGIELPAYNKIDERGTIINKLAKNLGVTLLIKGPYDYLSNGRKIKINRTGCPEMSIGGSGDVLAGLCASFLATKNEPFPSACSAAFVNGLLGEYCKKNIGPRFTAMDMINNINKTILNTGKNF